jgi:hypothetical protein
MKQQQLIATAAELLVKISLAFWNSRRLRLTITIITATTCMQIFSSSSYYWLEKFNKEQDPGTLIDEDCEDFVCFFSSASSSWPWKS